MKSYRTVTSVNQTKWGNETENVARKGQLPQNNGSYDFRKQNRIEIEKQSNAKVRWQVNKIYVFNLLLDIMFEAKK